MALSSTGGGRWEGEGEKTKTKTKKGQAVPRGPPIQYSLAPMKRARSWRGVDVGWLRRRWELRDGGCRGLPGRKGNSVGARFQSRSSRRLRRRRRRPHLLGLAFSSHLWRRLLLGGGGPKRN